MKEIKIRSAEFSGTDSKIEYSAFEGKKCIYGSTMNFSLLNIDEKLKNELLDVCRRIVEHLSGNEEKHDAKIKDLTADKIIAGTIQPPSNKPLTPTVCAQPLFTQIYLSWMRDPDADHYEVYGSREPGFAATYSTLLLKSKTHEFVHEVGVNERWFYRVRAIGKNGKVSNFTEEVSAKTVKPWYSGVAAKALPEWEEKIQLGIMQKLSEETDK